MTVAGILRRVWRDERGATAVEYAIVAPIFLLFVFGILEAGRLIWVQVTLDRAVAMAARCAAVNTVSCPTAAATQTYAAGKGAGVAFPTSAFTVTSTTTDACVTGSYSFSFIATYMWGTSQTLSAKACFPI